MFPFRKSKLRSRHFGLTLIELLIASSIMAIMAGVLGALALSVQMQSKHSQGHGEAVQHARVVIDRLQRLMNEATASEQFPGFYIQSEKVGPYWFPDTIVIWHPAAVAIDPKGLPRWNEVTIICPDDESPNILLEITDPTNTATVPATTDSSAWSSALSSIRQSHVAQRVELTPLLRTASTTLGESNSDLRGAIRFDLRLRPDDEEWADYKAGNRSWDGLPWVQGIRGTNAGLRQAWCRIELQLVPGIDSPAEDPQGQNAITFFGSAAVYYELHQ